MAGGPSVYAANYLLDKALKGVDFTPPSTWYVALFVTSSETYLRSNTIASASEVANAGAYARKALLPTQIAASTTGQSQITADIIFDTASAPWGTIYQAAITDSPTRGAGNIWWFGPLSASATIQIGDVLKIPAYSFNINM